MKKRACFMNTKLTDNDKNIARFSENLDNIVVAYLTKIHFADLIYIMKIQIAVIEREVEKSRSKKHEQDH
jgi:hypothetical protein